MVTREIFKLSPVRQLPVALETGALHVSFEGGIRSLFRGHFTPCSLARGGRSCLCVGSSTGEPKVCANGDLSVVKKKKKEYILSYCDVN